jgi:hypothetical protein
VPRALSVRVGTIPSAVTAPTAAFTVGTQVGVPTGTVLSSRASLGADDGSESYELVHPVTAATATRTVVVWRRKRFTARIDLNPGAGVSWLFDECGFEATNDFWCVDNSGSPTNDQMQPSVIFRRCTADGGNLINRVLSGHRVWIDGCHITGGADAWQGASYSVIMDSNVIATTDTRNPDPHADGVQLTDTGHWTAYHSWFSAGAFAGSNAAIRIGTEFGATTNIDVRYCGLERGGYTVQCRGDSGAADISTVTFIGNRWANNAGFGPIDFTETTGITWSDNAYIGGATIPSP